ncbi:YdcF family protein [Aureimonas jatrophae]|uniref:Uncharacterized SAM-binding protein YcdF, DUF218 family n=1 Tax=Aureimonas jatrophae TaxID=1166073 RepID=A0A1H0ICZ8_9HYPH|nr:YdcF family protein [Aureimonas jatrophae]MBB3952087.1 uncharacterized SAM-binding protein YcdF (DUF218 family) [Aureimonas jatrophae]SDO28941.1 Uncharacterized SAM-binding protein YcdF, DUF218 family [Aureimonas jatrophae]
MTERSEPEREAHGIRRPARTTARPRRGLRALAFLLAFAMLAGGAYLAGGFIRFARDVALLSTPPVAGEADGIVVLTGGEQRLAQGLRLLREGHGRRLLVSGVNRDTSAAALARTTGEDRKLFDCCVDLDYEALNTIGNAEMTARWAHEHGFTRLFLVTSDYHVPRSLLELADIENAPDVVPYPVSPDKLWRSDGWPSRLGLRLLATEYAKVIAVKLRQSFGLDLTRARSHRIARIG